MSILKCTRCLLCLCLNIVYNCRWVGLAGKASHTVARQCGTASKWSAFKFDADPEPRFHLDGNPDSTFFNFDADRESGSYFSSKWFEYGIQTLHGSILYLYVRLKCERPRPSMAPFWASTASEFWLLSSCGSPFVFDAHPDTERLHSDVDVDPASQNDADLSGSGSATLLMPVISYVLSVLYLAMYGMLSKYSHIQYI